MAGRAMISHWTLDSIDDVWNIWPGEVAKVMRHLHLDVDSYGPDVTSLSLSGTMEIAAPTSVNPSLAAKDLVRMIAHGLADSSKSV